MKRKPRARPKFDPSLPLRNPRHETFARARIVLETPVRAMELAGYAKPTAGNAARLDSHANIIARKRHLSASDNDLEMLTLRRNRLRSMYERIVLADKTKLFEEIEIPERNEDGAVILIDNKPLTRTIRALRSFKAMTEDERMLIEGLEFDGEKYKVKAVERLPAMKALREIDGLDRPAKVAFTDPEGKSMTAVVPVINLTGRPETPPA